MMFQTVLSKYLFANRQPRAPGLHGPLQLNFILRRLTWEGA